MFFFYYFFLSFYTHTTLRDGLMARQTELSRVGPLQVRGKYFRGGCVIIIFWPGEEKLKFVSNYLLPTFIAVFRDVLL